MQGWRILKAPLACHLQSYLIFHTNHLAKHPLATGHQLSSVPIVQNRIQSGDQTTNLVIVPQDGSLVTNSAILTIIDDDFSEGKKCGFGTGLTVFLLFAFALFFGLRLRRR